MDQAAPDFATARTMMVDSQIRPNKVTDKRVIAAMRALPREAFLPPALAARAYADEDVVLPGGRALMEPMVFARLLQTADIRAGERALVVGAGAGYGAAVLSACGAVVTALEEDSALIALARACLPAHAPQVTLVTGPLAAGWPAGAPYDLVLIEGAVEEIPAALAAQVKPGEGRLLTVLRPPGEIGRAVVAEPLAGGGLADRPVFDAATPVLPGMCRVAAFVF